MITDMVGYTALTQSNETQAMKILDTHNRLLRPFFPRFNGREVKTMGDSFLIEFDSALDALRCAAEIQSYLHDYNFSSKEEWKINLRIGIHLGDVIHQAGDVYGDAVNITSRLYPIADPGGICVSDQVYGQVRNKIPYNLVKLQAHDMKGIKFAVDAYKVVMPWEHAAAPSPAQAEKNRIAVLPFANMSPDPNDDYFSDGMTEELISTISKIGGLQVIARTSVMRYKDSKRGVGQIAQELSVGSVLEGSVRKSGDQIRINAQLIDPKSSNPIWAQSYDRRLQDVFAVQSEISEAVAQELKVRLLPSEKERVEKAPTTNPAAYELYLRGRKYYETGSSNFRRAIKCFERAIEIDPTFALAYVSLAYVYHPYNDPANDLGIPYDSRLSISRNLIEKALALDDGLAEAHLALSNIEWVANRTKEGWMAEEREELRSIELNSNLAYVHRGYGSHLAQAGNLEKALEEYAKSFLLDPKSSKWAMQEYGFILLCARRIEEALAQFKLLLEENPDATDIAREGIGCVYMLSTQFENAEREFRKALEFGAPEFRHLYLAEIGVACAKQRKLEEAHKIAEELKAISRTTEREVLTPLAYVNVALGELEEAIRLLELANEKKETYPFVWLKVTPFLEPIRSEPGFVALLERIGLAS